tara:strand:- start:14 stop:406 length:393 start_codon:yes stop_codon:yes gene_type:complete
MDNGDLPGGMYKIGAGWSSGGICTLLSHPLPWQKEEPWQRSENETVMIVPYKKNGKKVTTPYKVKHSNGRLYRVYFERNRADINDWYRSLCMPLKWYGCLYILPGGKRVDLRELSYKEEQNLLNREVSNG